MPDIETKKIPMTMPYDLPKQLVDGATMQNWISEGLPGDELSIQNYQTCVAYGILIAPNINPDISLELDLFKGKDAAAEIHARRISRSSVTLFCWRL